MAIYYSFLGKNECKILPFCNNFLFLQTNITPDGRDEGLAPPEENIH